MKADQRLGKKFRAAEAELNEVAQTYGFELSLIEGILGEWIFLPRAEQPEARFTLPGVTESDRKNFAFWGCTDLAIAGKKLIIGLPDETLIEALDNPETMTELALAISAESNQEWVKSRILEQLLDRGLITQEDFNKKEG